MHIIKPLSAAIALTIAVSGANAQLVLEEITVTATKKAESLQDIAVAVTAFSSSDVQDAGIQSASDVAVLTPSLNINNNVSPFSSRMSIRGIGTSGSSFLEPSVGVFVDGVYLNKAGLGLSDLADIERIEVLQGPQGTLYGKNTNAGALVVTTKSPNMESFEGHIEATVGNYDMRKATFSASAPIVDNLAYRISGNTHSRDGYLENKAGEDLNDADEWNITGKLLWEPSEALSVQLTLSDVRRDMNCCSPDSVNNDPRVNQEAMAQGIAVDSDNDPFDYVTSQSTPSTFEQDSSTASLAVTFDQDWGTLTSITAWDEYEIERYQETSRGPLSMIAMDEPMSGDSFSQELRIDFDTENAEHTVGLFYYTQETQEGLGRTQAYSSIGSDFLNIGSQVSSFGPLLAFLATANDAAFRDNRYETDTLAVFGRSTWHLNDQWDVTAGLRYSDETKDADLYHYSYSESTATVAPHLLPAPVLAGLAAQGLTLPTSFGELATSNVNASLTRESKNVDWLLSTSYHLNDETLIYVSVSTGTKSGGFNGNNGAGDDPTSREFNDEDTTNYELGLKSTLLDGRVRINSTLFNTQISEYQVMAQQASGLGTFADNQGEVEVIGLDTQIDAMLLANLTVSAGVQYLDKYEVVDGPSAGQQLAFAAQWSGNVSATAVFPLEQGQIFVRGDYSFMGDHLTNVSSNPVESRDIQNRETLNLNVGWRVDDHITLTAWAKNLTGSDYAGQTLDTFPLTNTESYFLAPPRTYGITARYDFH
jgi:iron complex outermembrane receptor protein